MKAEARFLAIDDAPFRRGDETVALVGVVTRGASYIEGVMTSRVPVDGGDVTAHIQGIVERSRFRPLLRALLLNGVFVGGLSFIDPGRLHEALGIPVVCLVRSAPRPARVRAAVQAAYGGAWKPEWDRIHEWEPKRLPSLNVWATLRGIAPREAAALVERTTVRGRIPEPLRLAHVIASGLVRGESRGRA